MNPSDKELADIEQTRMMRLFKPKHTVISVARTILDGLADGTVVLVPVSDSELVEGVGGRGRHTHDCGGTAMSDTNEVKYGRALSITPERRQMRLADDVDKLFRQGRETIVQVVDDLPADFVGEVQCYFLVRRTVDGAVPYPEQPMDVVPLPE
jgi:hypothetical protein